MGLGLSSSDELSAAWFRKPRQEDRKGFVRKAVGMANKVGNFKKPR